MTLVARYPMQEDAGTTVSDVAGGNDATATGATPNVAGPLGGSAWSFDGVDDDIAVPDTPALAFGTGDFTVSVVAYSAVIPTTNPNVVFGKRQDVSPFTGFGIEYDTTGAYYFNIQDGGASVDAVAPTTEANTYHHIVAVRDGDTVRLYLNGSLSDTVTGASGINADTTADLRIGRTRASGNWWWDGRVSDMRFYDHALDAAEASYLASTYRRGTVTLGTKSFETVQSPDLTADYSLNGSAAVLDVIGSPETQAQEVQQVTLDGTTSYVLNWNSAHTDFRIAVSLGDSSTITTATPTITSITIY